jgi:hypothetical protein
MIFTIDADSDLARSIRAREGMDMTLSIVAHDPKFTDVEKVVTGRLMSWTVRRGREHVPDVMEVEWMDHTKFLEMCALPASADL